MKSESQKGNKPEVKYWMVTRDNLFGDTDGKMKKDLRISKEVKSKVSKMLDEEVYYQDVKYYTHDFTFLRDFPEVALGSSPRRGFFDTKCLFKYTDLREQLQNEWNEEIGINKMLENNPDDANIRILMARREAMKRERERRVREGRD